MEIKDLIIDDRRRGVFKVHRSTMTSMELFQAGAGADLQSMLDLPGTRVRGGESRRLPTPDGSWPDRFSLCGVRMVR